MCDVRWLMYYCRLVGGRQVSGIDVGLGFPLVFIGGPCAIESRDHALKMAHMISHICEKLDIPWGL
jgi:2-dehydro-3-deoxyphosphooctonate aldolase (KDO 8-P synthase)